VYFFWRIFLKLCSCVFSFFLSISFFKAGTVSCFEKSNVFSSGNSPASHGILWSGGCIASSLSFFLLIPSPIPSMSWNCPARIFFSVSLAGQVDGDAHNKRRLISTEQRHALKWFIWEHESEITKKQNKDCIFRE